MEEQPRKLEHVIKILNICLEKNDNTRESYTEQAQELVFNENVLLQTLGFDVAIDHPWVSTIKQLPYPLLTLHLSVSVILTLSVRASYLILWQVCPTFCETSSERH